MTGAVNTNRLAVCRIQVQQLVPAMNPGRAPELERLFSAAELAFCRARKGGAESLAARYAAKHAILEVLEASPVQIEQLGPLLAFHRMASGQPKLDEAAQRLLPPGTNLLVTMTHSAHVAIAAVVLTDIPPGIVTSRAS